MTTKVAKGASARLSPPAASIEELAPAKVNLTLAVLGRRADGFHELRSLVAFADFGDRFQLDAADRWSLKCYGPTAGAIASVNIVDRVAAAIAREWPDAVLARGALLKELPVFAGIGGGSADAAAAIRAFRRLHTKYAVGAGVDWAAIACSLGADIPVCLASRMSLMQGIGERVEILERRHELPAVLINPGVSLPTARVFAELAAPMFQGSGEPGPFREPTDTAQLLQLVIAGRNDLEPTALRLVPAIGRVRAALDARDGCLLARMSGSGPTCFGLYDTIAAAEAAARSIAKEWPDWWVRSTVLS